MVSAGLIRIPCGSCVATAGFCLARLASMSCLWPSWQAANQLAVVVWSEIYKTPFLGHYDVNRIVVEVTLSEIFVLKIPMTEVLFLCVY